MSGSTLTGSVLVGNSVTDIQVSLITGIRSIGFAKTPIRGRELRAAGAHAFNRFGLRPRRPDPAKPSGLAPPRDPTTSALAASNRSASSTWSRCYGVRRRRTALSYGAVGCSDAPVHRRGPLERRVPGAHVAAASGFRDVHGERLIRGAELDVGGHAEDERCCRTRGRTDPCLVRVGPRWS
jgi:hypothetical protein